MTDVIPTIEQGGRSWTSGRSHSAWTVLALAVLGVFLAFAIFGSSLAPYDPAAQDLSQRLTPPAWHSEGSSDHLLGTDQLGRDVLSRIIVGSRLTLLIGVLAALVEAAIGSPLGISGGYLGGRWDQFVTRLTDIQMGFPAALLIIFIVLVFGASAQTLVVAFAINGWMVFARVARTHVRSIRALPFIEGSIVAGARPRQVITWHIWPHTLPTLTAITLLEIPRLILAESVMSFIGLGIQPPDISWGLMIGGSRDLIPVAYWLGLFPGIAIIIVVVSLQVLAEGVQNDDQ